MVIVFIVYIKQSIKLLEILSNYFGISTSLANYLDFITANTEVLQIVGFVAVLATPQRLNFMLIRVKIGQNEANKRYSSLGINKIYVVPFSIFPGIFFVSAMFIFFSFFTLNPDMTFTFSQSNHEMVKYWPKLFFVVKIMMKIRFLGKKLFSNFIRVKFVTNCVSAKIMSV